MTNPYPIPCPDILLTDRCNMACKYCFEKEKSTNDINVDKLIEYFEGNPCYSTFPFGGEPLLKLDLLTTLIDEIGNNKRITKERKKQLLQKTKTIITNGTLIKHNVDKIKAYGLEMQISIDGPKEINDKCRVFPNGKGTYDKIMENVEICIKNKIPWSIHGVVAKDTLGDLCTIFKFFYDTYKKYKGIDYVVDHLKHNTFQIIFEENYTDDDIDLLIHEFHKIADFIYTREELDDKQKHQLFKNWFFKHGGVCAAGFNLLALDHKLDIYPCHRVAVVDDKEDYRLGNVFKPEEFERHKMYNNFFQIGKRRRYMYSHTKNNHNYKEPYNVKWLMWCPSTNIQTSKSVFYQSNKYNLMFTELNRAINAIRKVYYNEELNKKKKNNTCETKTKKQFCSGVGS